MTKHIQYFEEIHKVDNLFDFSHIATIEIGIIYGQIMKATIMKPQKIDRGA